MIISSFTQMPVAGVPDPNTIRRAVAGGTGSAYAPPGSLSGLGWLGWVSGLGDDSVDGAAPSDTGTYDTPVINTPSETIQLGLPISPTDASALASTLPIYQATAAAGLPAPTPSNTVTVGTPGQSSSAWQQAMVSALISNGGQIMNNVTMPAGTLAVRNANGSVTYYRQPTGNTTNLPISGATGSMGSGAALNIGSSGLTGQISLPMVLLGVGALYLLSQRGGR